MNAKELKAITSKCWRVISQSDTCQHTEPLGNGWSVRATRIYSHRAFRVAWKPSYDLVAPDGRTPIAGYDSASSFAAYVAREFDRVSQ